MVMFASQWDPARYSLTTIHKAIYLSLDHLLNDQLVQEKGVILIIDWTGFTFRQCSKMQLAVLRIIVEGLEYGFPIRFKAIHCVGQSWYVETALALLKPFLRPSSRDKVRSCINFIPNLAICLCPGWRRSCTNYREQQNGWACLYHFRLNSVTVIQFGRFLACFFGCSQLLRYAHLLQRWRLRNNPKKSAF